MTSQLNYILAQQHNADLRRTAERARLAHEVVTVQRRSRNGRPIARVSAHLARLGQQRAPQHG